MAVRVGVDVGGTFTKAVACDARTGSVLARAVVPTTHGGEAGVAAGVVAALDRAFDEVDRAGAGPVLLVAHSTTHAVNALLEGDTASVGVLGMGRGPDRRRAARRTRLGEIRLAPGRRLHTLHAFLDTTAGVGRADVEAAVLALRERGAEVLCVSEAFGVEDAAGERLALNVAADHGIPSCAGHELSGLYGLEVRTVTAALNASILPAALHAASVVEAGVAARAPHVPLLVMRGDGGAADVRTMRRRPLLTAFSGPAASVAGALRHLSVRDGVVVEVGGTSTNVSVVRGGRPVLAYVRVLEHVTFVRSLDVRVVGVAGGSLVRVGRRMGGSRVTGVGPRSAHVAGLAYASFASPADVGGASASLVAPREGDPAEYVVLETPDGRRFAPTVTCAANALGRVPEGAYARGSAAAARLAYEAVGRLLARPWDAVAGEVLARASGQVADVVREAAAEHELADPAIVGLGGGAGAVVPELAARLGVPWSIPDDAEVISSIGDALSLVRIEVERGVGRGSADALPALLREAEEAALAAGASPESLRVETQVVPERNAIRAVALASVRVEAAGEAPEAGDGAAEGSVVLAAAARGVGGQGRLVARTNHYAVFTDARGTRFAIVDRHGSLAASGDGVVLAAEGDDLARRLHERVPAMVRHLGPVSVAPAVRLVRGSRLIDLSFLSAPDRVLEAADLECAMANGEPVVAVLSRS